MLITSKTFKYERTAKKIIFFNARLVLLPKEMKRFGYKLGSESTSFDFRNYNKIMITFELTFMLQRNNMRKKLCAKINNIIKRITGFGRTKCRLKNINRRIEKSNSSKNRKKVYLETSFFRWVRQKKKKKNTKKRARLLQMRWEKGISLVSG